MALLDDAEDSRTGEAMMKEIREVGEGGIGGGMGGFEIQVLDFRLTIARPSFTLLCDIYLCMLYT